MQVPQTPANEAPRLQALRVRAMLDTPAEERFDRLTRLAQHLFGVQIALVSLIDADRQWFKSRQGLDVCETARDISFCGHAILASDLFVVPDATLDARFADNPLVLGAPHIRFYAGAPLSSSDGYRLGTLCIIDSTPRTLSDKERLMLRDMADLVETEINLLDEHRQSQSLRKMQQLQEAITLAQANFIRDTEMRGAFDGLLKDLLALTDSEYGFLSEVLYGTDGKPYLKTYAITDIAWNAETRLFYDTHVEQGMEFHNLNTLFGRAVLTREPVIANEAPSDPRRGGLPAGHPALNAFLGLPIFLEGRMVAMLGIANRPQGYDHALIDFLHPLLVTIGQMVEAVRQQRKHRESQRELARLSQVVSQTTNGVIITDADGCVEWINEGMTRISGYSLEDLRGRRPGAVLQGEASDPAVVAQMSEALRRGEPFNVDIVNYARDGQPYWMNINCNPMRDDNGVLQGFMAVQSDISRAKLDAERIMASKQRLRAVIESMNVGTWEWNVQSGEVVYNERWAQIMGRTLQEISPTSIDTWLQYVHPDDVSASNALMLRHFAGETPFFDTRRRMLHRDGHWVWVHERGRVVSWTEDGKPLLMYGTHTDVTEQHNAEIALLESEARLRGLFEFSPVGIALNDYATGAFLDVNDALLAPGGYSREEFLKMSYRDITPPEYAEAEALQLQYLRQFERYGPYEKEYIRKDGSRYPVVLNGMMLKEESGRRLIWSIIEDVSERKRAEQIKSEFLSTVSHELRTPLTSIAGALSLLEGGALGSFPEDVRQMLSIAYRNSQHLTYLINDLLDMEQLVAGKLTVTLTTQPLMPVIETSVRENQSFADQFGVQQVIVEREDNVRVDVDAERLHQVMTNLLSNAAKFSPASGTVRVRVRRQGDWVRVAVEDDGQGVPEEFRDHIFQKFSQADNSDTRRKRGTGLGLAISRELVERMQGRIGFESVVGHGATFYFDLSINKEKQA
jgi:PAS domain S-box-containing protein